MASAAAYQVLATGAPTKSRKNVNGPAEPRIADVELQVRGAKLAPTWIVTLLETSAHGVFAAGDIRHGSVKRVTTAMGEGATVIQLVNQYLTERPGSNDVEERPVRDAVGA